MQISPVSVLRINKLIARSPFPFGEGRGEVPLHHNKISHVWSIEHVSGICKSL